MQAPAPATLRPSDDELAQTARLLIRLRWVAGLSILLLTAIARWGINIELPAGGLLALSVAVLGYNTVLLAEARRPDRPAATARRALWGQVALDWLAMVALVHLTGGITSPALIYFVIHVALAATLLPLRGARGLALLATLIVAVLAALEASGALPHIALPDLGLDGDLHRRGAPVLAALFFFSTTALTVAELVARQAEGLRQREARIRALNEARAAFSRAATHELRAPVASSLALVRSVEQGYLDELTPSQAVIIERVGARLDGLRELIDDLLDFAASREAAVAQPLLELVDLSAALADAIERERPVADARNIAVHAPPREPLLVRAEDAGLGMIFSNLINNAIKYTSDGGVVTVCCAAQREAGWVTIAVQDTGIGIPAAELPHIFDEFFRASNAKKSKIVGTGIGLAAVRAMVEHYHGTITLDSAEGEGTRVTVRLPLEDQRRAAKISG